MNSNFQYRLGSAGATAIQADSSPLAVADADGRLGWLYEKTVAGSDKFNWYYYSGQYENMTMDKINSMYFIGSIDTWSNETSQAPFFVVYTKMKNDGTDAGSWYHSRHSYVLHKESQLVRAGEKCIFYALDAPESDYGLRSIPFKTRVDTGDYDPSDEVSLVSLQSDSGATNCSIYVENLGMECAGFGRRVGNNFINMKLLS